MSARRRGDSEGRKWSPQDDEKIDPYSPSEVQNVVVTFSKLTWDAQIRSLERLRGSLHDSQGKAAIMQNLRALVGHIITAINSPRSMVAVASVHTVNAFVIALGPKLDPDLPVLIPTLLSKLIESSKAFLCDDAASALAAIVARGTPRKTIATLLQQRDPKSQGKQTGISWLLYQTLLHHGDALVGHLPTPLTVPSYHNFLVQLNQDPAALSAELAASGAIVPSTPRLTASSSTSSLLDISQQTSSSSLSGPMGSSGLRSGRHIPTLSLPSSDLDALPELQQATTPAQGSLSSRLNRSASTSVVTPRTPSAHPRTPRGTGGMGSESIASAPQSPSGVAIRQAHQTLCLVAAAVAGFAEDRSADARLWAARALLLLHVLLSPIAAVRDKRLPPLSYAPVQSQHYANLDQQYASDDVTQLLRPIEPLLPQDPGSLPGGSNNPYAYPLDCLIAIAVAEEATANSGLSSTATQGASSSALLGISSFSSAAGGGGGSLGGSTSFSYSSSSSFSTSSAHYGGGGVPTSGVVQSAVANALTAVHRVLSSRDWQSEFLSVINDRQEVNPTHSAQSLARAEARVEHIKNASQPSRRTSDDGLSSVSSQSSRSSSPTRLLHSRSLAHSARRHQKTISAGSEASDLTGVPERTEAPSVSTVDEATESKQIHKRSGSSGDFVDDLFSPDTPTNHTKTNGNDQTQTEVEENLETDQSVEVFEAPIGKLTTTIPRETKDSHVDVPPTGSDSFKHRGSNGSIHSYLDLYRMSLPPDHPDSLAPSEPIDDYDSDHDEIAITIEEDKPANLGRPKGGPNSVHNPEDLDSPNYEVEEAMNEDPHDIQAVANRNDAQSGDVERKSPSRPRTGGPSRPMSQRLASALTMSSSPTSKQDNSPARASESANLETTPAGTSSLSSRLRLLRSRNLRSAGQRQSETTTADATTSPQASTKNSISIQRSPSDLSQESLVAAPENDLTVGAARLALLSVKNARRSSNASASSLTSSTSSGSLGYAQGLVVPVALSRAPTRRLPDGPITATAALEHSHSIQMAQAHAPNPHNISSAASDAGSDTSSTGLSSISSTRMSHAPGSASVLARLAARMQNQQHAHVSVSTSVAHPSTPTNQSTDSFVPRASSALLHLQQRQQHSSTSQSLQSPTHSQIQSQTPSSADVEVTGQSLSLTSPSQSPPQQEQGASLSTRARLQLLSSRIRPHTLSQVSAEQPQ